MWQFVPKQEQTKELIMGTLGGNLPPDINMGKRNIVWRAYHDRDIFILCIIKQVEKPHDTGGTCFLCRFRVSENHENMVTDCFGSSTQNALILVLLLTKSLNVF